MQQKSPPLLQMAKAHFLGDRLILVLNGLFLLILVILAIYVRLFDKGLALEALFGVAYNWHRPYFGALTTMGNLFLCTAMSIYGFSAIVLRRLHPQRQIDWFSLSSAIVAGAILLDRMFRVTTMVSDLGGHLGKLLMFLLYGTLVVGYGLRFRRQLAATPYLLIVAAFLLLVFGGLVDLARIPGHGKPAMLEEGSTLIAMLNVAIYAVLVCQNRVLRVVQQMQPQQNP